MLLSTIIVKVGTSLQNSLHIVTLLKQDRKDTMVKYRDGDGYLIIILSSYSMKQNKFILVLNLNHKIWQMLIQPADGTLRLRNIVPRRYEHRRYYILHYIKTKKKHFG